MRAVNIAVSQCTEGDIAAADILSDNGTILVTKDTSLNSFINGRLMEMGISHIHVYSSTVDYPMGGDSTCLEYERSYKETVISVKQIIKSISRGEKIDYGKVIKVSELIYDSLQGCDYIIKCMNEIRGVDEYTYNHCVNTAFYSMLIGKWLGRNRDEIKKLILSGLLHDIGKVKIPVEILNKNKGLTSEEFELVKNHTVLGYGILDEIDEIEPEVKRAALLHHERVDRSGYPFNASHDSIGLYAKVVAIADVFDAMTSDRIYKKRVTPFEAFEMFMTTGIGCFDTTTLYAFVKNIAKHYIGADVALSSGESGRIVYIPPGDILCPIVETSSGFIDLSRKGSPKVLKMV